MKKVFIFLSAFLLFIFIPQVSLAEVIRSFDVNVTAFKNGEMLVTEKINYDFESAQKHGIFRDIPLTAKIGDLYRTIAVKNVAVKRDGSSENYQTTNNSKDISIKIGNKDIFISGAHLYEINYTVTNGIGSNFPDHDEIYWNATGNDWDVAIEKVSLKISTDFNLNTDKYICFTGIYGAKEQNCTSENGLISSLTILNPGEGLSGAAWYRANTFPKSLLSKNPPQAVDEKVVNAIFNNLSWIFLFFNFILPIILIIWYFKRKNKKRFGPPAVNFDIPKDEKGRILRPAIAGTIDTGKLERDDVVATIFDLAIRKYLKIEETKKVIKLMPDEISQNLIKLKNADANLEGFEKTLFNKLFAEGSTIKLSDLRLDFYSTFNQMETDVFKLLVDKKYYSKNPKVQRGLLLFLGIASLFTFNFFLGIVLLVLSRKLNGRTALGDELDFKIDGLKLFLKSMDRNYKWQAEKFYTVEQMIPYAIALGYIDKFMEQLKIINPDYNPTWYSSYRGSFLTHYAVFYAATSSNFTTSAPSSSSGFSGGGSSGGGGGGGGGGSW